MNNKPNKENDLFETILAYKENEWAVQRLTSPQKSKFKSLVLSIKNKISNYFKPKQVGNVDLNLYDQITHYKTNEFAINREYCSILDLILLKLFSRKFKNKYIVSKIVDFISYEEKAINGKTSRHNNFRNKIKPIKINGTTPPIHTNEYYDEKLKAFSLQTDVGITNLLNKLEEIGKPVKFKTKQDILDSLPEHLKEQYIQEQQIKLHNILDHMNNHIDKTKEEPHQVKPSDFEKIDA